MQRTQAGSGSFRIMMFSVASSGTGNEATGCRVLVMQIVISITGVRDNHLQSLRDQFFACLLSRHNPSSENLRLPSNLANAKLDRDVRQPVLPGALTWLTPGQTGTQARRRRQGLKQSPDRNDQLLLRPRDQSHPEEGRRL